MSFLGEIKRRRVFQVAAVYVVVAWLIVKGRRRRYRTSEPARLDGYLHYRGGRCRISTGSSFELGLRHDTGRDRSHDRLTRP